MDTRHHYKLVPFSNTIPKDARLDSSAWRAQEKDFSLPFGKVATTSPSAPFYSASAANCCARDADLQLLRDCDASPGGFKNMRTAWLGELLAVEHQICFEMVDPSSRLRQWYVAGSHFPDSSALVLEVERVKMPGTRDTFWFEFKPITRPVLVSIFDLAGDAIRGCSFKWMSWLQQYVEYPSIRGRLDPAIRMVQVGQIEPLRKVAARNGFWAMSRAEVQKFSKYLGVETEGGEAHCDEICKVVMEVLGCEEDTAVDCCHKRAVALHEATSMSQELAQCEAALQTFEQFDHDEVVREQRAAANRVDERRQYGKEFVARKRAVMDKKHQNKKRTTDGLPKYPAMPSTISQATAKQYLPPGCSIWRGVSRCNWNGHCPGYPRCSAMWAQYGEEGALVQVLQKLWDMWLEQQGLDRSRCLVEGLFSGGSIPSRPPGSSRE